MIHSAYIGLGTNIGDRLENIKAAIRFLNKTDGTQVLNISSIYESEPMYKPDQNPFYNAIVEIKTELDPVLLLQELKKIEEIMGRNFNAPRNSPRIIDLDIEYFNDLIMETDSLKIPHPAIYERLFVLKPMNELDPNFKCNKTGKTVRHLLAECPDKSRISKVTGINLKQLRKERINR